MQRVSFSNLGHTILSFSIVFGNGQITNILGERNETWLFWPAKERGEVWYGKEARKENITPSAKRVGGTLQGLAGRRFSAQEVSQCFLIHHEPFGAALENDFLFEPGHRP